MLDAHCHLDLYPDPAAVADRADRNGVFTVMVTNLPSGFERSREHVALRRRIRIALGLHPLLADQHVRERATFKALVPQTSFIGEVGLDFSQEGKATADLQVESFDFVLRSLGAEPKFVSVHSRRAEAHVITMLRAANRTPVVFHWYSGPLKALDEAVRDGHYFSVNPAMLRSENGRRIVSAIPRGRVLTETDGPFVTVAARPAEPGDVIEVEHALARLWGISALEARASIADNFRRIIEPLRAG